MINSERIDIIVVKKYRNSKEFYPSIMYKWKDLTRTGLHSLTKEMIEEEGVDPETLVVIYAPTGTLSFKELPIKLWAYGKPKKEKNDG